MHRLFDHGRNHTVFTFGHQSNVGGVMGVGTSELLRAVEAMGQFKALAEMQLDNHHTCANSHHRYPFPLEQDCPGCMRAMDKHVKCSHLEGARILGWNALFDNYVLAIKLRIAKAEAYRHKGAYI